MTHRVFISYAHKDEKYKSDLEEHLSILQRNNVISLWHDRKIILGEDWQGKIDENLDRADIVLFLISPSFLASDYCCDIEVKKATENYRAGKCHIASIIIRPCDWKDSEFAKFQVAPTEGKPISTWSHLEEGWLDSIKKLKEQIESTIPRPQKKTILFKNKLPVTDTTNNWLEDTGISLTHRNINKISLSGIYTIPDIEYQNTEKDEKIEIKSSKDLLNKKEKFLIYGEEQQGKTSLLKYYYKEFLKMKFTPIYIDAEKIKKSSLQELLKKPIQEQYETSSIQEYLEIENKVILIDNLEKLSLNNKFKSTFIENINREFNLVFITCHNTFTYIYNDIPSLDKYEPIELLGFGHKKREEITRKWLSLGKEETISDTELFEQCDEITSRLNIIIKKNIVPPKPIYILMLLQMFEANTQLKTDLTSYGHCYQQLIYQTFENAKIRPNDFEKYLNVLSELAWWILVNNKSPDKSELDDFFEEYCKKYLPVNKDEVVSKLTSHSILQQKEFITKFKYPYIYYFFAAKKIAESYQDSPKVKEKVEELLELLHREDFANILIFITHHTKDAWVLIKINKVLDKLFSTNEPASLEKSQLAFMEDFMKKIPELVLEQREIRKERDIHNERLDNLERKQISEEELEQSTKIFADINKTFKGMEIAGQIIRNRHASLTKDAMTSLAESGITSGLRFLENFISISDAAKNEVIKLIANYLTEQPYLTDQEIERDVETAYMHLTYGVINAVLRKIASSIGSKEALSIYENLEKNSGTAAASLIRLSIDLQFNKTLKFSNVTDCSKKLRGNAVCTRILKEMVIQHTYMFPVEYKEKQQLSSLLDISVQGQRLMDQRKAGKG